MTDPYQRNGQVSFNMVTPMQLFTIFKYKLLFEVQNQFYIKIIIQPTQISNSSPKNNYTNYLSTQQTNSNFTGNSIANSEGRPFPNYENTETSSFPQVINPAGINTVSQQSNLNQSLNIQNSQPQMNNNNSTLSNLLKMFQAKQGANNPNPNLVSQGSDEKPFMGYVGINTSVPAAFGFIGSGNPMEPYDPNNIDTNPHSTFIFNKNQSNMPIGSSNNELQFALELQKRTNFRATISKTRLTQIAKIIGDTNFLINKMNLDADQLANEITSSRTTLGNLVQSLSQARTRQAVEQINLNKAELVNLITQKNNFLNQLIGTLASEKKIIDNHFQQSQSLPYEGGASGHDKNNIQLGMVDAQQAIDRITKMYNNIQTMLADFDQFQDSFSNTSNELCVIKRGFQFWKSNIDNIRPGFSNISTITGKLYYF